jgi:hypothetical protein
MIYLLIDVLVTNPGNEVMSFFDYFKEPSTIISTCALAVSIIGICIGLRYNRRTFKMNQRHQLLTVKPIIDFIHITDENQNSEKVILKNDGLGPALIESVYYYRKDTTLYRSMDLLMIKEFPDIYKEVNHPKSPVSQIFNFSLSAKTEFILFEITYNSEFKDWIEISKNCYVIVSYRSIYDEFFTKKSVLNPYKKVTPILPSEKSINP